MVLGEALPRIRAINPKFKGKWAFLKSTYKIPLNELSGILSGVNYSLLSSTGASLLSSVDSSAGAVSSVFSSAVFCL